MAVPVVLSEAPFGWLFFWGGVAEDRPLSYPLYTTTWDLMMGAAR